jgi:N-acetylmuramoyl-L-alanine amidase
VRPHRQANFAVLRAPEIPSVLVEMGFLSNPEDEKLLNLKSYQARLAERLVTAVDEYFHA